MTANVEALVREGIRAYRAGNKAEARTFLEKAVELDQYNEEAWLWLSAVVDTKEEQRTCLENVLVINPNNARAKQGLLSLGGGSAGPTSDASTFADTSFAPASGPTPSPAASSFDDGDEEEDYIESSVQWGAPADDDPPPRPPRKASALTADDYDNWINSLNIGTSGADTPADSGGMDALRASTAPSDDDLFDISFGDDEDFSLGAASTSAFVGDSFDQEDFASEGPFKGGPFSLDEDVFAPPPPATPPPARPMPQEPRLSPMADTLAGAKNAPKPSLTGNVFADEGDDLFGDVGDSESEAGDTADPDTYLRMIPKAIKPTRLPGVVERYPPLVLIGLIALVLANVGALALAIARLTG